MGIFIQVIIQPGDLDLEMSRNIAQLCPVDIFQIDSGSLTVNAENEDECTLCNLCLDAAPANVIKIHKLYKDETLVSRGSAHG